jgi:DNA-binding NtrC family response regulator
VYARLLHRLSGGSDAQLQKINCSILEPAQLLKQVQECSRAHLESPHPGTLLLDGIDELDPGCQRALLSVLPDSQGLVALKITLHELFPQGRNLEQCVETGQFRRELYFRSMVFAFDFYHIRTEGRCSHISTLSFKDTHEI